MADLLRARRSVRRFTNAPIPDSTLREILATAAHAPSAHNRQPWRFAVLTRAETKTRLAQALSADYRHDLMRDGLTPEEIHTRVERSQSRILQAPAVIILCMDAREMDTYPDPARQTAERVMAIQSVANAGTYLQLAAHATGLGSVWTCAPLFAPQTIAQTLDLPPGWEPQAMFFLGYPAESPRPKTLKPLEEITFYAV
jgi:coenzyme F420-0:L-glutamate ligase / coenzyme F420-1:gamma-L-glutamate ligase